MPSENAPELRVGARRQADEREQLVDLAVGVAQPARRRLDLHVLARRRAGVDGRALDERADLAHGGGEAGAAGVLAEQRRRSFARRGEPEQDADRGGLAGAVGAEQAADRPLGDGEREAFDGGRVAVALDESVECGEVG